MNQSDLISRIFHIYRLSISSIMLGGYLLVGSDLIGEVYAPKIFLITALCWFVSATLSSFGTVLTKGRPWLVCCNFLIDMLALALLGWATGGLNGGLFFLMLPSSAMAGLILPPRYSLLVAAIATIAILFSQTLLILNLQLATSAYFSSGVLGVILFLSTTTFSLLSQKLSKVEELSMQNKQLAEVYQQLNENIIGHMETGVIVIDENNNILLSNRAAEQLLSIQTQSSEPTQHSNRFDSVLDQHKLWKENPNIIIKPITLETSGITIKTTFDSFKNHENNYCVAWLEDLRTIQMRAQQFKYQSLSKLSSGLAHEIRNPLSAIQQANELLCESESLIDLDKELTQIIGRHCLRMNEIIEVIQQLSRNIEANRISLNLQDWLTGFIFEFKETLQKGSEAKIDIEIDSRIDIHFDPRHLKQILTNILGNGLKHGGESISQTIKAEIDERQQLVFLEIHDSGEGISKEKSAKIFDPFFTTSEKGSGLGLYLARELCEANYASINYLYSDEQISSGYFRLTCNIHSTKN